MTEVSKYGVLETPSGDAELDLIEDQLRRLGYATLDAGFSESELSELSEMFEAASESYAHNAKGAGFDLAAMNEQDIIRVLPAQKEDFWKVVFVPKLHSLLSRLLGGYYILNQVNGLINRGGGSKYHQAAYHRDLPYQHFTSSRPLAINALFALDDFTLENGATRVIPASHLQEGFPADDLVPALEKQVTVKRGTFIVLDCMVYHAGATNTTAADRRAINHVFTIPMFRQQFHFPSVLGAGDVFSDAEKKILGYGLEEFRSVDAWLASRSG